MKQPQPGTLLWFFWVILTTVGGTLGLFITMFLPIAPFIFLVVAITLSTLLACAGQWYLLRRIFQASPGWIATGLVGIFAPPILILVAAQIIIIPGPRDLLTYLGIGIGGALIGTLLGSLQKAAILARLTLRAERWTQATALAWGLGWAIGTPISGTGSAAAVPPHLLLLGWTLTWAVIGVVTGGVLFWRLQMPQNKPASEVSNKNDEKDTWNWETSTDK